MNCTCNLYNNKCTLKSLWYTIKINAVQWCINKKNKYIKHTNFKEEYDFVSSHMKYNYGTQCCRPVGRTSLMLRNNICEDYSTLNTPKFFIPILLIPTEYVVIEIYFNRNNNPASFMLEDFSDYCFVYYKKKT